MRVFVTGATGWVGSAVVKELLGAGHSVVGLARSEAAAQAVEQAGATAYRGDIADPASLAGGVAQADGVIHTAFDHDFSKFRENCEHDQRVILALAAAAGTDKPLLVTSATAMVRPGGLAKETDTPAASAQDFPRVVCEAAALAAARDGARVAILRLPLSVHGDGDRAFVAMLTAIAREKGVSGYIGEGANRWPAVHRFDAAHAYRLALENGARGVAYHLVAEEGVATRDIAEAIGKGLGVPVVSIAPQDAAAHFGFLAGFFALDCPCSSVWTFETLGWAPGELGLIDNLARGPISPLDAGRDHGFVRAKRRL